MSHTGDAIDALERAYGTETPTWPATFMAMTDGQRKDVVCRELQAYHADTEYAGMSLRDLPIDGERT